MIYINTTIIGIMGEYGHRLGRTSPVSFNADGQVPEQNIAQFLFNSYLLQSLWHFNIGEVVDVLDTTKSLPHPINFVLIKILLHVDLKDVLHRNLFRKIVLALYEGSQEHLRLFAGEVLLFVGVWVHLLVLLVQVFLDRGVTLHDVDEHLVHLVSLVGYCEVVHESEF